MWPPIEMFGIVNVISRLRPSQRPRPLSQRPMPRLRATTMAAPIRPKTAPEAPADSSAENSSTPSEPHRSETK